LILPIRRILYLAVALPVSCASFALHAQDLRNVVEPAFPQVCTQLTAQLTAGAGGLPAAAETLPDTARIQAALNSCTPGQAVELAVGAGQNAYLIAPIQLPKGVTLLVDAGVTVFASRNPRDYDADAGQTCGTIQASSGGCVALITANSADGAGVMGFGVIDGRGELPMLVNGAPSGISWWDLARNAGNQGLNQNNPRLLQVNNTNNFTLYKITLMNAPQIHVFLSHDTNVTVWGIKIITPYDARNTDGVDPAYSSNVTVANSYISDGDDNFAINASNPGTANMTVVNNHFGDGHGGSIGSYTQGGVTNIWFDRISIAGDAANTGQIGIRIKSDVSRGGVVQNVIYSNICMHNVRSAIVFDPFYTSGATGALVPNYRAITIENLHATTEGLVQIQGHDASVPTTVTLNNVQIDNIKASDLTQQYVNYTLGPDPVNFASFLRGTGVTATNNISTSNAPYACPAAVFSPIAGELIPGPSQLASGQGLTATVQVFPTKAVPYATYQTNLKTNPNATLALTAPTGTVTIYDGSTAVGTGTLTGSSLLNIPLAVLTAGVHTLTAAYSGDANYAAIGFGNYVVQVRSIASALPVIAPGGVANAASFAGGTLPYGIAQGSLFSIFGANLGPGSPVQAAGYPLQSTLGGASVRITQAGQSYDAWPAYVSKSQINAILPSAVPAGSATVTVAYNGAASQPAAITVVPASPGIFFQSANGSSHAIAQNVNSPTDYPLNQPATPARPGQIVLLWGTGLGAVSAADNIAPGMAAADLTTVPVTISVGGIPAQRLYAGRQSQTAGVDNVYFTVPAGVAYGCAVPVAIMAGGVPSNTVSLAITADGSPCQ
jgi:uncharacterized protein (TIGR03437 family)